MSGQPTQNPLPPYRVRPCLRTARLHRRKPQRLSRLDTGPEGCAFPTGDPDVETIEEKDPVPEQAPSPPPAAHVSPLNHEALR